MNADALGGSVVGRDGRERPTVDGARIDAIICGLGLPWQRGIWIGRRKNGTLEIEQAQAPTGKPRTRPAKVPGYRKPYTRRGPKEIAG